MKHRNVAEAVVAALESIFGRGDVASVAVERTIGGHPKWGKRDRNAFAETVYEIVRWRRLLAVAAGSDETWALLGAFLVREKLELPAWPEFAALSSGEMGALLDQNDWPRAVRESVPDWLDAYGQEQLGARWSEELRALNHEAPVVIRANTLITNRDELRRELQEQGIETSAIEGVPEALQLEGRPRLQSLAAFRRGAFAVQDAASQLVAPFAQVEPGMNVVDACAGAGGKTLHLAALMKNVGRLLALDVSGAKLGELERRAHRAGAEVKAALVSKQLLRDTRALADRLLLDAPCSGSGTLRRQPDLKWRLSPEFLKQLQSQQRQILLNFAPMVRPGGKLVYATCSIFPDENERQIEWLLDSHPAFELEETRTISSADTGFDGFFMARLKKK